MHLHERRRDVVDDARGARLGTLGLIVFATVVWLASSRWPAWATLALATFGWAVTCGTAWMLVHGKQ